MSEKWWLVRGAKAGVGISISNAGVHAVGSGWSICST
jgi:hypothetical protein